MTGYTPSTFQVRHAYAIDAYHGGARTISEGRAEFDRWLAAHDAEVLEKLSEVADRFHITDTGEWIRQQARATKEEA